MICFIKIVAPIEPLYDPNFYHPFEWKELQFGPLCKKGILRGFESEYEGLRIVLYYDKISISNSLHKFYKGNNHSDFTYSEVRIAIQKICAKFEIQAEFWEIIKLEFGFIVFTPIPALQYKDLFLEYKGKEFDKMKDRQTYYGRKCFMNEYSLKVYDKSTQTKIMDKKIISEKILRIELSYDQKRKLPKQIKTLSDLMDKDKFKLLYIDLNGAFSKVIFNDELDFTNSSLEERTLFNASLNPNFLKVEERINKTEAKAMKVKIKQLKERFFKKGVKQYFLKLVDNKYIELYCN